MRRLLGLIVVLAALAGAGAVWWLDHDLRLSAETIDLSIEPGTPARGVVQVAIDSGIDTHPVLLYWWFRLSGRGGGRGAVETRPASSRRSH